ncbi:MAG: type I glyceraldehyde-3-phosphate dehydrogenase, partial [Candidatus Saccharibacteria bacterium]
MRKHQGLSPNIRKRVSNTVRVGINGFGRIGRLTARIILQRSGLELVAVNDIGDLKTSAHLFKYDSVHGIWPHEVKTGADYMGTGESHIKFYSEKDPGQIPWADQGVDIVVEATGRFTKKLNASEHLRGTVKKVLVTAPGEDMDFTMVMGVNQEGYEQQNHHVVSNASCTTNCLAPVVKVLNDEYGIVKGLMTTIHSYTNDQRILDLEHKDLRRARASGMSIIPTSTGAAKAIGLVIPELAGKLNGVSMRVPTPNVSLVDLVAELKRTASKEEINQSLLKASQGP